MKNIFKILLLLVIFVPTVLSAYSYGTEVSPSPNYGGCSGYWDGYNCLPPNVPYQCERGYVEYRGECVDDRTICGSNETFDYSSMSCKANVIQTYTPPTSLTNSSCGMNSYSNNNGSCSCLSGYEWVSDDPKNFNCKKKSTPITTTVTPSTISISNSCGQNSYSKNGICLCSEGYEWVSDDPKNFDCKKKSSSIVSYNKFSLLDDKLKNTEPISSDCGKNTYSKNGICFCLEGYEKDSDSRISRIISDLYGRFDCKKKSIESVNKEVSQNTSDFIDRVFSKKLAGRILLQVESKGEGWYVNPADNKRYFLGKPADAFNVMRELGLGVSNKDFNNFKGYAPKRLSGQILLKVEDSGKAYYVNPIDLKIHYLGKPSDAFSVMRNLGLGVSNIDIKKIETN